MPHRIFLPFASVAALVLAALALVISGLLLSDQSYAAEGAWKDRTHIIFDKAADKLIRKNFRVWDPHPEFDLDFLWEPDPGTLSDIKAGDIINGAGTLTWHVKGAANYDRRFTYSVFKGVLKNGRPERQGVLGVRSGLSYTGQWVNGEMHGHGELRLANGDKYEGDFVAGKMHGTGRYASTDGYIFFGEFRNGVRHGVGQLTLVDGTYRTVWRDGREIARKRIPSSTPAQPIDGLQLVAASPGVKLKLTLDRKTAIEVENRDPDSKGPAYDADYAPGRMTIRLASKKRLAAWKQNGVIATGQENGPGYIEYYWKFSPVFLQAELQNQGATAAQVKGAFLDVQESMLDPTPYLELHQGETDWCDSDGSYNPVLDFENLGWGEVVDARMIYSFGTAKKRTDEAVVQLGSFDTSKQVSIDDRLRKLGVNVEKLTKASTIYRRTSTLGAEELNQHAFKCDYDYENGKNPDSTVAACFEQVKRSGVFGSLRDFVFRQQGDNVIYTALTGRIEYQRPDGNGANKIRVSTFTMFVPLIKFNVSMAEMGCESALKPDLNNNIELPLDGRRRRISLPEDWNGTIGRNELRRFNFSVSAPKSSSHLFQLVLELADGSQVTSPTVDLSYFEPRLTGLEERRRLEEERQQRESEQREQEQQQQDPPK
jgi:hypothetical protein